MNGGESRDLRNVMSGPPAALPASYYKDSNASSKPLFSSTLLKTDAITVAGMRLINSEKKWSRYSTGVFE
nr:Hypothetical protein [Raoultella ornithinolytica]